LDAEGVNQLVGSVDTQLIPQLKTDLDGLPHAAAAEP
jgi:hypothetical protein